MMHDCSGVTRRIRLLYVIATLDVGGTEGQLIELVTRLDPERFERTVCSLSPPGPHAVALKAAGIRVETIPIRGSRMLRHPIAMVGRMRRLVALVRETRPDIVHGFLFWAYVLGALAARLGGARVVVASRRSLGNFKARKPHYGLLERLVNRTTDLVIANSEAVRQDTLRRERLLAERVIVIYNGVDLRRFEAPPRPDLRRTLGLGERTAVVGVVANLIQYKGLRFFLEAWASLASDFPGAVALLVGDGPLRGELEAQVQAAGVRESVRFLGTRSDVPELLGLMDFAVHPALEEGFSNAILEAMAAGRAVVATSVGGNPEAIVPGETGLLVPPADSKALASAMRRLLEHPAEAAAYGTAGRWRVRERFDLGRMVNEYQRLYERLARPDDLPAAAPARRARDSRRR
jgi:glycosyltransferase involved in cell wall biosynthesis